MDNAQDLVLLEVGEVYGFCEVCKYSKGGEESRGCSIGLCSRCIVNVTCQCSSEIFLGAGSEAYPVRCSSEGTVLTHLPD